MTDLYDVVGIGNAIVDVIAPETDEFLAHENLPKGGMQRVDERQAESLRSRMGVARESSRGCGANTIAGVASFGGRAAYIGKVANDQLGKVFTRDLQSIGVDFATARCLINVTPDGERTLSTYLGASNELRAGDIEPSIIEASRIVFLEGYLFDPVEARRAFAKPARVARAGGRQIALSTSDAFVVDRHRSALLEFIDTEVDVLFANESEIKSLFQTDDFDLAIEAVRDRCKVAAVTRGAQGSVTVAADAIYIVPAEPVSTLEDTTGAGDAFAAGFLFGLSQGHALPICAKLSHIAAAEVISHYGARPRSALRELAGQSVTPAVYPGP